MAAWRVFWGGRYKRGYGLVAVVLWVLGANSPAQAQAPGSVVYRCPGNPVLYTDALSAKEAKEKGCRALEGAPITVIQSPLKARAGNGNASTPAAAPAGSRPADSRVDPNDQRARDTDARRILESELRKEEEKLAAMQKDLSAGEAERRGDERNYQKYLDRINEMKAAIARKESDIAAIKRELAKLPQ